MKRGMTLFAVLVLGGAAFGLYQLSYAVQRLDEELALLNQELLQERETIAVLHAEWSWKTRPARLQGMVERHMPALAPIKSDQIIALDALPRRAEPSAPPPSDPADQASSQEGRARP